MIRKIITDIPQGFLLSILLIAAFLCRAENQTPTAINKPAFCDLPQPDSNPGCGKTPTALFDQKGVLWVVYLDGDYIKLTSSIDMANSYRKSITVNKIPEKIYADGENRPKLAFGADNEIYLSWVKKTAGRYTGDIRFSRSLDNGKTFSTPITINDDGLLSSHRFDTLAVAPDGQIHLLWLDKRDLLAAKNAGENYQGSALYHSLSKDRGDTFSANEKIADHSCECCRISLEFDQQGNAIALWRHIFANMTRDHAIIDLSHKDPEIRRVTFDNWQIDACPHHGPDMSIDDQNRLHLFWFTGIPGKGGLFYGRYDQIQQKLEYRLNIDPSPMASRPQIHVSDKRVFLVWKTFEEDTNKLKLKISEDNGNTWSETMSVTNTMGSSDHPHIITHKNRLFISWWTKAEGFRLFPVEHYFREKKPLSLFPFNKDSLKEIKANNKGHHFLLVLWSLDCPPCFSELKLLARLNKERKLPKLVFVATDGSDRLEEIKKIMARHELEDMENWYFNAAPERLRSSIDPEWYGELPRTYAYRQDGSRFSHSGSLSEEILERFQIIEHVSKR